MVAFDRPHRTVGPIPSGPVFSGPVFTIPLVRWQHRWPATRTRTRGVASGHSAGDADRCVSFPEERVVKLTDSSLAYLLRGIAIAGGLPAIAASAMMMATGRGPVWFSQFLAAIALLAVFFSVFGGWWRLASHAIWSYGSWRVRRCRRAGP